MIQQAATLIAQRDWTGAETVAKSALGMNDKHPDLWQVLGVAQEHQGHHEKAVTSFERSLRLNRKQPMVWNNLGHVYMLLEQHKNARRAFEKALKQDPNVLPALQNLGAAERLLGNTGRAEKAFRKVLRLDPNFAPAHTGLGRLAEDEGRVQEAIDCYLRAWTLDTSLADPMVALSTLQCAQGHIEDAIAAAEQGLAKHPKSMELRSNRAIACLSAGRWADGWDDFEARLEARDVQQLPWLTFRPRWDGTISDDLSLLLWSDQGLGELVLACHALSDLLDKTENVALAVDQRLHPVLSRSFPKLTLVGQMDIGSVAAQSATHQAPAFDLIRYTYPSPDGIPARPAWLTADKTLRASLKEKYRAAHQDRPLVGLGWTSTRRSNNQNKSLDLGTLAPVLQRQDIGCVSLQHGDIAREVSAINQRLGVTLLHDATFDPLSDTETHLAQIASMDAVITTSSTVAHFAGALGIPTTLLLPERGAGLLWHWFRDRTDSPWYPSMTILHYQDAGDLAQKLQAWTL